MQKMLRKLFSPLRRYLPIIGTLMLATLLAGCGATRLAYNNAPTLSYWYLDAYFDFDSAQKPHVKTDLRNVQAWHRKNELPLWIKEVEELKARASQNADAESFCRLSTVVQQTFTSTLEQMVPTLAALVPQLSDAQLQHISKQYEKKHTEWREKYVDGSTTQRLDHRVQRTVDRVEMFYGKLRKEQVELIRKQFEASAYDPSAMYREKLRQHQDVMQVLRQLRAAPENSAQIHPALRALLHRSIHPADPVYRQTLDRVTHQGCATMALLHNSMNPAQRRKLQDSLQGYADDFRYLYTGQTTP